MIAVPLLLFLVSFRLHGADRERVQRAFSFGKAPRPLLILLDFAVGLGLAAGLYGDIGGTDRASRERCLILRMKSEKHIIRVLFSTAITNFIAMKKCSIYYTVTCISMSRECYFFLN